MLKFTRANAVALVFLLSSFFVALPASAQKQMPWMKLPGGAADIAVGANGTAFVTGSDANSVWKWNPRRKNWDKFGGGLARIAVDPRGNPWGVNKGKQIWRHDGRKWHNVRGGATDIAVGANGTVWIIGANKQPGGYDIWRYKGNNAWQRIPGGAVRIAVDPKGMPWVINSTNTIFRYNGKSWQTMPGRAKDVGIGANGAVWVVGTNNSPYSWNGRTWIQHTGGLNNITVDPKGYIWGTNAGKQIWTDKRSPALAGKTQPVPTALKPTGATAKSKLLAGGRALANQFPLLKPLWSTWERTFRQEGVLLKANVRILNQSAIVIVYRPRGKQNPNIAVLVDNFKISNLIKDTRDTFADDLQVNNATYIFAPNGNAENINSNQFPSTIRQQVEKVRTGPISVVSGQNLFAVVDSRKGGTTANLLKKINVPLNNLKVHAAYGRRISKVTNKSVLYNAVRLSRPGKWEKPFKQQNISITKPTVEYAKIRGIKFIRAWGNGVVQQKPYFVFLQKNLNSGHPFPTAAALDAKFISLRDYINYTTLFTGTIFNASPEFNNLVARTKDIPLDEVRIEHPNYRQGSAVDADNNPIFTNVLVMAAATGDVLPDLAETTGQALVAQGNGRVFGIPAGKLVAKIYSGSSSKSSKRKKFAHMEVDASVALPKWGPMIFGKFAFSVRKDGNKFAMNLQGGANVSAGPIKFNQYVTIKATNSGFKFNLGRNCPLQPYGIAASVNSRKFGQGSGFKLSKTGNLASCIGGPLGDIARHLENGVEFVGTKSKIAKSLSNDAWAGLSQSIRIPGSPISPRTLTNFTKKYKDPAKALKEVGKKGAKAIKNIANKLGGVLGGGKKKKEQKKYFIRPKDCGGNDDWNIKWATCWKRGTEMIRLASAGHLCLSVNGRKKKANREVQVEKCHGDWNQQWIRKGNGNVIHGWGSDGCLEWRKSGNLHKMVQNGCNSKKVTKQTFHRDRFDRLVNSKTGLCLQVDNFKDDAFIFLNTCVFEGATGFAHRNQRWLFKSADAGTTFKRPLPPLSQMKPDKKYRAIKSITSNKCLAATPFSTPDRTKAQMLPCSFVGVHGSKWQWFNHKLMSQKGKCLGARLHFESVIVEHIACNEVAKQWPAIFKVGNNVMIKHQNGSCLAVLKDGRPWLWGCDRKSKYSLFSYR